jgi:hypothetical protein
VYGLKHQQEITRRAPTGSLAGTDDACSTVSMRPRGVAISSHPTNIPANILEHLPMFMTKT